MFSARWYLTFGTYDSVQIRIMHCDVTMRQIEPTNYRKTWQLACTIQSWIVDSNDMPE